MFQYPSYYKGVFSHKTRIFDKYLADFRLSSFSADTAKLLNMLFFLKYTDCISVSCTRVWCTSTLKLSQSEG